MSNLEPVPTPVTTIKDMILPGVLRTFVPIVYALLIKAGFVQLGLDDVFLQGFATAIVTTVLYALLRVAERYQSQIGWLLGYAKQPVYVKAA